MATDIALIGRRVDNVVRVPVEAVEGRGEAASVFRRKGESFVRHTVATGITDGRWIETRSGLQAGDVIRMP